MSFENFPTTPPPTPPKQTTPRNDYRNIITGALVVILLGTWGYIIWDKNKTKETTQQLTSQIVTSDSSKNELQRELNDAA